MRFSRKKARAGRVQRRIPWLAVPATISLLLVPASTASGSPLPLPISGLSPGVASPGVSGLGGLPGLPSPPSGLFPFAAPMPIGPVQSQPSSGPSCPASAVSPASTLDANGPQGMDTEGACAQFSQGFRPGDPETIDAYVEGGVNWHLPGLNQGFADHIYVNWRELPIPCIGDSTFGGPSGSCQTKWSSDPAAYDVHGTGLITVEDWAKDPRVKDANGNGFLDTEDLIVAFSCFDRFLIGVSGADPIGTPSWPGGTLHCTNADASAPDGTAASISNDGSGFPHDISGWNFYNNSNDPATIDAAYTHSDGEMQNVMAYCPKCMVMPVKAGAEALDGTVQLAEAWLYAGHAGAKVITSVTADLGYSSLMRQAISTLQSEGVAMVEASNDFDSTDHQGGMFWPGVVPGNGVLVDQTGTGWIRSDITSWGTHNLFDVAGQSTTSSSTAVMGGLFGLLMAEGQDAYHHGLIAHPFTGAEAVQVMRQASSPVTDTSLAWPGAPGEWSEQYGYGIPNLDTALGDVATGNIAPTAQITSPDWYSLEDPTTADQVEVDGAIGAPRDGSSYRWVLSYGLGAQPSSWTEIGSGSRSGDYQGRLGTLSLNEIPRNFYESRFRLSTDRDLSTADQYDVTLRVVVTPDDGTTPVGVDRRSIDVVHDSSWAKGFPLKISSSGESQPALVDLQGTGRLDIVFGTTDGLIHAVDPTTGGDIPGWPVRTQTVSCLACSVVGIPPPHDPIIADVAVGDLRHNGQLAVVATTEGGEVYVISSAGKIEPGWPQTVDTGVSAPTVPRPSLPYNRQPIQGAVAAPVLAPLSGTGQLDVVQAGWDGYLHAWDSSGKELAGWPVKPPTPTAAPPPGGGYALIDDQKLDATPAVAYLDGPNNPPSLVERSQYSYTKGAGIQFVAEGFVYAFGADGSLRSGWPIEVPTVAEYYSSAQEFVTEGTSSVQAANVTGIPGQADDVVVGTAFTPPLLYDGSGHVLGAYGGPAPGVGELTYPGAATSLLAESHLPDVPVSFATTGGAFGAMGGTLHYAAAQSGGASLAAAELEANGGFAINEYESVFQAVGGPQSPGFPAGRMGINFLGSPIFTSVDGTGLGDVVDGGDSDSLTAYTPLGTEAPGFPKWTTGWTVFSPASGDLYGDGGNELVTTTREGFVFVWKTAGSASGNGQWWRWQHDEYNSGNYGTVSRPPGAVRELQWKPGQRSARFTAPGAHWYDGTASSYLVTFTTSHGVVHEKVLAKARGGRTQSVRVPAGARSISIGAVGPTGLLGRVASAH